MTGRPADPRPDLDADLATLRELLLTPPGKIGVVQGQDAYEALDRVEAELASVREERDALAEASQFPVETVMSWKRQVDDAKRRSASALLLLDPERQDEPDEENARRAFKILSGLRPPTFRPDRERADAAEARCARLQQALRDTASLACALRIGWTDGMPRDVETGLRRIEALAGPDTPADICPECAMGVHVACLDDGSSVWTDRCKCDCGDTPADSQPEEPTI